MVVAVTVMWVVEVAIYKIADMIAMGHCRVTAARTMNVVRRMTATVVALGAGVRVFAIHRNTMLVYVVTMGMMKVTIVQVVYVAIMLDSDVATAGPMNVVVIGMNFAIAHTGISRFCRNIEERPASA